MGQLGEGEGEAIVAWERVGAQQGVQHLTREMGHQVIHQFKLALGL